MKDTWEQRMSVRARKQREAQKKREDDEHYERFSAMMRRAVEELAAREPVPCDACYWPGPDIFDYQRARWYHWETTDSDKHFPGEFRCYCECHGPDGLVMDIVLIG